MVRVPLTDNHKKEYGDRLMITEMHLNGLLADAGLRDLGKSLRFEMSLLGNENEIFGYSTWIGLWRSPSRFAKIFGAKDTLLGEHVVSVDCESLKMEIHDEAWHLLIERKSIGQGNFKG